MKGFNFYAYGMRDEKKVSTKNLKVLNYKLLKSRKSFKKADLLLMPYQSKISINSKNFNDEISKFISPLKMFEYMATGIPIISSNIKVLREKLIHNHNCLLVDEYENVNNWIISIKKLNDNSNLRKKFLLMQLKQHQKTLGELELKKLLKFIKILFIMVKIGILNKGSIFKWGYNFGYWYFIKYFNKELNEKGYNIRFYQKIDKEFLKSDLIILNSRIYTDTKLNLFKKKFNIKFNHDFINTLKKLYESNPNIVWLDLSDSAGNTQFEVLPFVKKYVKKQFYKDKSLYKKNFFRNRFYADYYQKNYNLENESKQKFTPLSDEFAEKLVLGWNIGVGNYFDTLRYNKFFKLKCILKAINCPNYKDLTIHLDTTIKK